MSLRLQLIVGVLLVVVILSICNMVRRRKLDLRYSLAWLAVCTLVLILDIFPDLLGVLAQLLGVGLPVNMLFFLGFVFSLFIIFLLTCSASKQSERVKRLTQEIALLEERLRKIEDKKE